MFNRSCWDCFWRERVDANSRMSTCKTRNVGAVLVRNNRTVADGFNGNLPGYPHCVDGACKRCLNRDKSGTDLLRCICVHAETNIYGYCAKWGIATADTTLYLPITPCLDCAKLAIIAGTTEIVYLNKYPESHNILETILQPGVVLRPYQCACGV